MIYLLLLMIHTWVRRPPSGPNMYIFFITLGAEGEGWDAVKLAYLSPPVIHYWSFQCGTFNVVVFVKWFVVFYLQMFFFMPEMATRMQAVFEDRYMKVKLDIWKLSLGKSVAAFLGKGCQICLSFFCGCLNSYKKKKKKICSFSLWYWELDVDLIVSVPEFTFVFVFLFFFFFTLINKINDSSIVPEVWDTTIKENVLFVQDSGTIALRLLLYITNRWEIRERVWNNEEQQCQIHCTWYSSSMKMCLSCQPNEDWRPLNG